MAAPDRPLTPKQAQFCREYVVDFNGAQAALRAGYGKRRPDDRAFRLLRDPRVQAQVARMIAEKAQRTGITADSVLQRLNEVADRCMTGEPIADKEGNETGEWRFDSSGANRALELLGKHLGLFVDRFRLETGQPLEINLHWSKPVREPDG